MDADALVISVVLIVRSGDICTLYALFHFTMLYNALPLLNIMGYQNQK